MKTPLALSNGFGTEFEKCLATFSVEAGLLPDVPSLHSTRFLNRSIIPHVQKLSGLFNRDQKDQSSGLQPYWKESSNPAHLRLAYFLYFMPANLFRVASIWAELSRLGFRWGDQKLHAVEFGAGPASGACGIAAGEHFSRSGLPTQGTWALIEQDKTMLDLGSSWAQHYFSHLHTTDWKPDWGTRTFHRKIDFQRGGFLPKAAPKFNLWLMSFYLNEITAPSDELASALIRDWEHHLEEEGIIILVEPALKLQSRRLLELRKQLLAQKEKLRADWLQVLLPCLGHQACGALSAPEDWCHEEVTWWRPPYFRILDRLAGLDRRTLPFSYLVLTKSRRPREEILPQLMGSKPEQRHRLVSPAHSEGRELEFFLCSEDGKRRARYRPENDQDPAATLQRGNIFIGSEIRGDRNSSRISKFKDLL